MTLRWANLTTDQQQAILVAARIANPKTPAEWVKLAAELGYSYLFVRRACDPVFSETLRERERRQHIKRTQAGGDRPRVNALPEPLYFGTRDDHPSLTGRIFGDPLPGRSALDRERGRRP